MTNETEEAFYPCSGSDAADDNIVNISLTPVGPGPWDSKARAKLSSAQRRELINQASHEMRFVLFFSSFFCKSIQEWCFCNWFVTNFMINDSWVRPERKSATF